MRISRSFKSLSMALAGLTLCSASYADDRIPSVLELKTLPPYCPYTQIISKAYGNQQSPSKYDPVVQPYIDQYGYAFWGIHHYCFALVNVNRAYAARDASERRGWLRRSLGEFDYIFGIKEANASLLSTVHTSKGNALLLLKDDAAAIVEWKKAISLKPDYARPYFYLSDYYEEQKKKDLALQALEEGLTHNPASKSLLNRYKRLGGEKTFEIPKTDEASSEKKDEAETQMPQTQSTEAVASPPSEESVPRENQPPGNPYCRFCP